MPSWGDLVTEFNKVGDPVKKQQWIESKLAEYLLKVSSLRGDTNVILYGSAFLQKPMAPGALLQISSEDINGFMSMMHGMDWKKGLTLILHTPGGVTNSTETIVAYLRSKFENIEVIVPTFAMSAGTMISLAADKIIMGRQSQLGPIDPQMPGNGRIVSAIAIIDQFERAKAEISADVSSAHVWAPILSSLGPALLQESQNAIDYSEKIVAEWLEKYMYKNEADPRTKAIATAMYFSRGEDPNHKKKSHGRRIDRVEALSQGVTIEELETNQDLQEAVLTAYHLMTIVFNTSPGVRLMANSLGKQWAKNG